MIALIPVETLEKLGLLSARFLLMFVPTGRQNPTRFYFSIYYYEDDLDTDILTKETLIFQNCNTLMVLEDVK